MERLIGLLLFLVLAGCSTATTRFPTCYAQPANSEIKSYTWHDPFPDEQAGPKTFTRPQVFSDPRTDSRKDFAWRNQKAAYGFPKQMYAWDPSMPVSVNQYPVQPIWRAPPPVAAVSAWQN